MVNRRGTHFPSISKPSTCERLRACPLPGRVNAQFVLPFAGSRLMSSINASTSTLMQLTMVGSTIYRLDQIRQLSQAKLLMLVWMTDLCATEITA